jgi:hypothetical protein
MNRSHSEKRVLRNGLLCLTFTFLQPGAVAWPVEPIDFSRTIAPILEQHCVRCHSPVNEKGDISLATIDDLRDNGYVVAGEPDSSYLIDLITAADGDRPEMPKDGNPLAAEQVVLMRRWIAEGASWPEEVVVRAKAKADSAWWSLQPLATLQPPSPQAITAPWIANPIDRFVFAKLAEHQLRPNPPAGRRSLIRRATFDLIGLPPTPDEVEAFVSDPDPNAYERVIDRLLQSPHYGERWGRHWLDVVRFGESNGYERNFIINDLWPFRDYVIRSFDEDKPFDQFIREHLAGDFFGKDQPDVEVGTAFLVAGPYDDVGNQDAVQAAQIRADTIDEMIRATSEAFLGLTIGCARCHDHKFDPIQQRDYYGWYATFSAVRHGSRALATAEQQAARAAKLKPLEERRDGLTRQRDALLQTGMARAGERAAESTEQENSELATLNRELADVNREIAAIEPLPMVWVGTRNAGDARGPFHVFLGGSSQRKGDEVVPASLSVFNGMPQATAPADKTAADQSSAGGGHLPLGDSRRTFSYQLSADSSEAERRLALADWIAHRDNPLTPRVLANRLWHYHFGTGLVDTPSDFGYMGGRPTHPELLDWLAAQLRDHDWRLKPLHKLVMMSQTYQQSSELRDDAAKVDGDARLLWRFPPRRLSAEEIRDTMLFVSGKLDTTSGGPGFRLYHVMQDNVSTYVPLDEHGRETYRRAVYHQNIRASVIDLITDFDQPDCAFSTPNRAETTTPLQALTMLNHSFTLDMARFMAERLRREAGEDPTAQVQRIYALCYGRQPTEPETTACVELIGQHSLVALCRVILNTSELIYVN